MTIRVLHIFAPNFRQRFGGPVFNWQLYFSRWNDPTIEHLVFDTEAGKIFPAQEAFDFDVSGPQKISNRWERWTWTLRLIRDLREFQDDYDLIHFHLLWWGSLLASNWAGQKKIATIYESVLLGADTPGAILEENLGRIKVKLFRKFSSILAISDGIAADFLDHDFPAEQVHTQMNSIDTETFQPPTDPTIREQLRQSFHLPDNKTVLLFTGSLIHRKGVDILVEAFIKAYQTSPNLFLWLVGPLNKTENGSIDESFVTEIRSRITQVGLSKSVRFQGMISDRKKLAEAYQAADVFVFPSRNEGLPNVVLEAMACGLPVIVSDLPGLKGVIRSGEDGVIVPIGDSEALRREIPKIALDQNYASTLGRNARLYIETVHSFDAWQKDIAAYYKKIMNKDWL